METQETVWQQYVMYLLIMVLVFFASTAFGQVKVIQFNAGWNSANEVPWVMDLEDCNTYAYVDIAQDTEAQTKYIINNLQLTFIFFIIGYIIYLLFFLTSLSSPQHLSEYL